MKALNMLRSLGGVLLIAVGAIIAAFVGRLTVSWAFIPTFIVFETVTLYLYYRAMFRRGPR